MPNELTEVVREYTGWRRRLLDLPLVCWLLQKMKKVSFSSKEESSKAEWGLLRTTGERLARRRVLFVATEAAGQVKHVLPSVRVTNLQENLAALIREGNSLHKVRALRAMRFIASDECLPVLEIALRDPSAWVKATAIRTLFRLNLREHRPRAFVRRLIWRSFRTSLVLSWSWFREIFEELGLAGKVENANFSIFGIIRGMVAGLWRERCHWLAIQTVLLAVFAGVFNVIAFIVAYCVGMTGFFGVMVAVSPALPHRARFIQGQRVVAVGQALLNYATVVCCVILSRYPTIAWSMTGLGIASLSALSLIRLRPTRKYEDIAIFLRGALVGVTAWLKVRHGPVFLALITLALVQILSVSVPFLLNVLSRMHGAIFRKIAGSIKEEGLLGVILISLMALMFALIIPLLGALLVFAVIMPTFAVGTYYVQWLRILVSTRRREIRNFDEYLAYIIAIARNPTNPEPARVRAVLRLTQFPLADPRIIHKLLDVAEEENLPAKVTDAIYQVVDSAETRIQRGQANTIELDLGTVTKDSAPISSPSAFFRPFVVFVIAGIVASAAVTLVSWRSRSMGSGLAQRMELAKLAMAIPMLIYGMARAGKPSKLHLIALVSGAALIGSTWTYHVQGAILARGWGSFPLRIFDTSAIFSFGWGVAFSAVAGIAGYCMYLLLSDALLEISNKIFAVVLTIVVVLSIADAPVFHDYVEHWREPLPKIAVSNREIKVEGFNDDGRVMRLALILPDKNGKMPSVDDTFPVLSTDQAKSSKKQIEPALDQILKSNPTLKGEAWLAATSQIPRVWQNLGSGCLHPDSAQVGQAVFTVDAECSSLPQLKLLVLVYNRRRSPMVANLATREHALNQLQNPPRSRPFDEPRLLNDTLSFFVNPIWVSLR